MSSLEKDIILGAIGLIAFALGVGILVIAFRFTPSRRHDGNAGSAQSTMGGSPFSFAFKTAGIVAVVFGILCTVLFVLALVRTINIG
jgi:multisubunit Na+/H+ antiporter MnhB subunit